MRRDLGIILEAELAGQQGRPAQALRRLEEARFWTANPFRLERGVLTYRRGAFMRAELLRDAERLAGRALVRDRRRES